ncbi:DUF7341 domain-containing protein [Saccharopolyspora hattusasensis]|uniref:DUF7341 domain-containing protein n=1 Tax=Saccharopolyspora hattusasensis TaxID=1128679 RepID=UPI003D992C12
MSRQLTDADQALRQRIAFDAAIDQLTRPVLAQDQAIVPSLLDQLADAVQPGSEHTGKTATGSRPPAAMDALALAADIGVEMRQALAVLGEHVPPAPVDQVRAWAAHAERWQHEAPDYLTYATDRAGYWVHAIRTLLDPPRRYPLRGHACPSCWETTVSVWSDSNDEAPLRRTALTIDVQRAEATCGACEATWPLDQWQQLAALLLQQQQHDTLSVGV